MNRLCLLPLLLLVGCAAAPALLKETNSGKAEATFTGVTLDEVRSALTYGCAATGKEVTTDTHAVTCSGPADDRVGFAMQLLLGNRFSGHPQDRIRFTIVALPADGVFVVVDQWLEMSMGFGEKKISPLNGNAVRNEQQAALDAIAAQLATRQRAGGAT